MNKNITNPTPDTQEEYTGIVRDSQGRVVKIIEHIIGRKPLAVCTGCSYGKDGDTFNIKDNCPIHGKPQPQNEWEESMEENVRLSLESGDIKPREIIYNLLPFIKSNFISKKDLKKKIEGYFEYKHFNSSNPEVDAFAQWMMKIIKRELISELLGEK
jgi:hypothetical protein